MGEARGVGGRLSRLASTSLCANREENAMWIQRARPLGPAVDYTQGVDRSERECIRSLEGAACLAHGVNSLTERSDQSLAHPSQSNLLLPRTTRRKAVAGSLCAPDVGCGGAVFAAGSSGDGATRGVEEEEGKPAVRVCTGLGAGARGEGGAFSIATDHAANLAALPLRKRAKYMYNLEQVREIQR